VCRSTVKIDAILAVETIRSAGGDLLDVRPERLGGTAAGERHLRREY